jgi:hypothetical protein
MPDLGVQNAGNLILSKKPGEISEVCVEQENALHFKKLLSEDYTSRYRLHFQTLTNPNHHRRQILRAISVQPPAPPRGGARISERVQENIRQL